MRFPSTTEILSCYAFYDGYPALDPQRQQDIFDRGILVGRAVNHLALGKEPPWKEPHPELDAYLDGYRLFLKEHQFTLLEFECEWVHESLGFLSHPDQVGLLQDGRSIVEIKTGGYNDAATRLQTAGQALAGAAQGLLELSRYCLHLPGDGSYRLYPHTDKNDKAEFIALVQVAHVAMKYDLPLGRKLKQIMEERSRD